MIASSRLHPTRTTRRSFLKIAGGAGLLLGMGPLVAGCREGEEPQGAIWRANPFVQIAPDNTVTVFIKHHEMGQGITTGLATLVAEELDADWEQIRTEYAPADANIYGNLFMGMQGTGGSTSIANSYEQMRQAGATARAMLVAAAAKAWGIEPDAITVTRGTLKAGEKAATFGALAAAAAKLPVPDNVALKPTAAFTLIGTHVPRLDSVAKSTGQALYTIDVQLPALLTAVTAHPPVFGATVASFDAEAAKKVRGVKDVVQIPEGVAVVAEGMWPALKGRDALNVTWDTTNAELRSSSDIIDAYKALLATPGKAARRDGDVEAAFANASTVIEAVYEFPYLAHAPMEPLNCVAWLHDGTLETWSGHQLQTSDQAFAAKAAGLPPEKVILHSLASGGSFGRRASTTADHIVEAVHIAKAVGSGVPIRLQRTREDDMRAGYYRPIFVHGVKAALDETGALVAWSHKIVGQSIMANSPFAAWIKDDIDPSSVEGVQNLAYAVPNMAVDLHSTTTGVPPLWWRSVGNTHSAYVVETLIDELATAAKKDPVAFRLALLRDKPRHKAVLSLAAEKAGWGTALRAGKARGIAVHESFNSYVAQVVELGLDASGRPKVDRVVVAVDCGVAVNPDIVVAQMEGCVGFALSAALYGEITLDKGAVVQGNFDSYECLRIDAMPKVEVYIVPSTEKPTGVGEPGVPPTAPALANALAALTGTRVRVLPFAKTEFKAT